MRWPGSPACLERRTSTIDRHPEPTRDDKTMQQEFQEALDNTLASPKNTSGQTFDINIVNNTSLELNVIYVGQVRVHNFLGTVAAGKTFDGHSSYDGAYYQFSLNALAWLAGLS